MNCRNHYLDIFKVTEPQLDKVIATALARGGDFADIYFEYTTFYNLILKDGAVSSGGFHTDYGVGIRVLNGEKTGYAYSENPEMGEMLKAAEAAGAIAQCGGGGRSFKAVQEGRSDFYPMQMDWRRQQASAFLPFLLDLEKQILAKDSRIVKVIARLSDSVSDILMYNSLGELTYDTRPMGSLSVSVVFQDKGMTENRSVSRSFRTGAELISPALAKEIADEAVSASYRCSSDRHGSAKSDFNRKGQSIFSEKIGQRVCPKGVNVVDDGTISSNRGAVNYDDEGVPGQKTYMVEDGILRSYLHDRISAAWYGVDPTGNGRRENFRYNPIPRMRATYMESGNADPEGIISSVKNGIYVDEFSNGQVKIGEGDFTFFVKSGFLIENGRLTTPVKDINIIGNGPQALADIVAVGNDLKIDNGTWTCGKEQSVAVSCGMPTVLISNLTVGGVQ